MTIAPDRPIVVADPALEGAVEDALTYGWASEPPIEVGARLATPAELKAARGAATLAGSAGWGWTVGPRYARGWRQRKRPSLTWDHRTGEVWSSRDSGGGAAQVLCPLAVLAGLKAPPPYARSHKCREECEKQATVWQRTDSIAVRLRHNGTGIRAVGLWSRLHGPKLIADRENAPGRVEKETTWSAITPELWWWRIELATLGQKVERAYHYPRPVAVTDLRNAVAKSSDPALDGPALIEIFETLPIKKPAEKDED